MQTMIDTAAMADLLSWVGAAHGVYEERELGGVYDQCWPQWYAVYLVEHGLGGLAGIELAVERVAAWLSECDVAYKAQRPALGWPAFYAGCAELLRAEPAAE